MMTLISVVNFTKILQAAFAQISFHQNLQSQTVIREKLLKTLSYKKASYKMLVKLIPGCKLFHRQTWSWGSNAVFFNLFQVEEPLKHYWMFGGT
jgi:hypothetical protein